MKKTLTISLLLFLATCSISLMAQNKEIPNKQNVEIRPQTGGAEGGNGASTRSSSSDERPIYRPRVIQPNPYFYNPPIYYNPDQNNGVNNSADNDAAIKQAMAARKRAMAEVELKKALFEFKAPVQSFDVKDVSQGFDIIGLKGFKVSFPELAFVDEEGNPVLGEVEVQLTEYTENSEFAEAGLTTMTTEGLMLETGGMVNIEAKSGDKKLSLGAGKSVKIEVPELKDRNGFQTFYGSGSDFTVWSLTPNTQSDTSSDKPFDGYTIKMAKTVQSVGGKTTTMLMFKNWKALDDYVNENLKVAESTRSKIFKDGIPFLYTIEFNAVGKVKEVKPKYPEYSKNTLISEIQGKIKTLLMDAPAVSLNDGNLESGRGYDIMFVTAKNYINPGPFQVKVNAPLNQNEEKKHSEMSTNANPNAENVDGFVMESSGLSKINCDRFAGSQSKDTQTFHFERADAKVYVVFKNQRSFIQPTGANGNYMLTKVPTGSAVRYVAVVYGDDGTIKMAERDAETNHGNVVFDTLGDFSAEGLKAALNRP